MTSQVYYRKWRPSSFAELVGQEHVATTLRQSLKQGRVSHSYLFCGPRGSGKTTTARIIAKAVNCLDLRDGDPCNVCTICSTINDGRFMDIIELDAASNRGIDEIRDIREKVNFSPAQGSRKVYIIDEAHMLTDAASNAFLKTLEEPPAHVIFVLCTTEVQKILPTIVSRCQRFDFRRIPSDLIYNRLAAIAEAEGVTVEPEALRLVARYASGSLRDAQNLLEQLVVSYGDGVGLLQVEDLLGLGHGERWLDLVKYLLMGQHLSLPWSHKPGRMGRHRPAAAAPPNPGALACCPAAELGIRRLAGHCRSRGKPVERASKPTTAVADHESG